MFKLQKLEISGFKSFADYTEVLFTGAGITAVVGPNGCGKSNISDCITWVLGEQKAKNLRGGEMQDVIFAGTKTRPPSGMAEVVLHLVRDESINHEIDSQIVEDLDEALNDFDEHTFEFEDFEIADSNGSSSQTNGNAINFQTNGNGHPHAVTGSQSASSGVATTATKRKWQARRRTSLDFAPNEAITITRRLYRSGESEYLLNGRACRLRDIQDLFAGTGLSGGHYALVQQEKISQILSAKPADRRALIEEAAGITKFRTRQRAAEIRLESAKNNLRRISDIVSEVDKQAVSLRRQAARTRRFKELQEILNELLKKVFAAEGRELNQALTNLRAELETAAAHENKLIEAVRAQTDEAKASTQAAREAEENLAAVRQKAADAALRRERLSRDVLHQTEQIRDLEMRCAMLEREIKTLEERLETISADAARLREKNEQSSVSNAADAASFKNIEDDYQEKLIAVSRLESQIERLRQELLQHTTAAERFGEIARQQANAAEKLVERIEGLEREGERAAATLVEKQAEAAGLKNKIELNRQQLEILQNDKQAALQIISAQKDELRDVQKALNLVRDEANGVKTRRETLAKIDANNQMLAPIVQKIFQAQEKLNIKLRGTLADLLQVEARFERAVESALGPHLQAVIVEDKNDLPKIFEWLKANKSGNLVILNLDSQVLDQSVAESTETVDLENPILSLVINAEEQLKSTLRTILPQAMDLRVIENLDQRTNFAEENCVTLDGEIVFKNQLFAFAQPASNEKNAGILSFKRELRELAAREELLRKIFAETEEKVAVTQEKLTQQEKNVSALQSEIVQSERELMSLEVNAKSLQQEIERAARHQKIVEDEKKQLENERFEADNKRSRFETDAQKAQNEREAVTAKLGEISASFIQARERAERVNSALSEQRAALAAADERRRSLANALRRVESEQTELKTRINERRKELDESNAKLKKLRDSALDLKAQADLLESEKEQESQNILAATNDLQIARARADQLAAALNEINLAAGKAKDARAALEISQAEIATRLENLREICQQELNQNLAQLLTNQSETNFELTGEKRRVEELREKIESFGAVNLLALEELNEAEERLLFLTSQRKDIVDGIAAAEDALDEIKRRSRERFRLAFDAINRNFTALFAEIFGGGRGEMNLLDAADVLESGIEIVAQPPGKRLQNLLLLSGGEKAMTAIALVLAIFRFRPAPFCLLDEVDAPLDEANVNRFVEKIAQMSEQTQFIVITHNKRTMEAARALYGVTMEEAGISKLVSVKFE